jgi:hypothetical protein
MTSTSRDRPPRTTPNLWLLAAVLAGTALLLLLPLDNSYQARWYGEAKDAFHWPLFALLTWVLAGIAWPRQAGGMIVLAAALAIGAEFVQPLVGRSASLRDAAYGLLGVASAAVWLRREWNGAVRLAVIAVLAAWPAWRAGPSALDALWAWRTFPELAASGGPFEERRWELDGVRMSTIAGGGRQLEFAANASDGSRAVLFPVVVDWTAYQTLEVSFEFEGEPLLLLISVRDGKRLPPELPRYDLWRRYPAGRHDVRIDLAELARGGNFPPIELDRVQSLLLVAYSDQQRTIRVKRIALANPRQ